MFVCVTRRGSVIFMHTSKYIFFVKHVSFSYENYILLIIHTHISIQINCHTILFIYEYMYKLKHSWEFFILSLLDWQKWYDFLTQSHFIKKAAKLRFNIWLNICFAFQVYYMRGSSVSQCCKKFHYTLLIEIRKFTENKLHFRTAGSCHINLSFPVASKLNLILNRWQRRKKNNNICDGHIIRFLLTFIIIFLKWFFPIIIIDVGLKLTESSLWYRFN